MLNKINWKEFFKDFGIAIWIGIILFGIYSAFSWLSNKLEENQKRVFSEFQQHKQEYIDKLTFNDNTFVYQEYKSIIKYGVVENGFITLYQVSLNTTRKDQGNLQIHQKEIETIPVSYCQNNNSTELNKYFQYQNVCNAYLDNF